MTDDNYRLPVFDTVEAAWHKVKGSKSTVWLVIGAFFVTVLALGVLGGFLQAFDLNFLAVLPQVVTMILQLFFIMALVHIGIQRAFDIPVEFNTINYVFQMSLFFRVIGLILLQFLVILPAVVLAVLPSVFENVIASAVGIDVAKLIIALAYIVTMVLFVYLGLGLYLARGIVIEQGANPWLAIKLSFHAIKSNRLRVLCLLFINIVIFAVSLIPFGIGLIWSIPYLWISYGVVYKRLVAREPL